MADKRQNIDVNVELHDELSRPARRAEDAIDELGDEVSELAAESAAASIATSRLERSLKTLQRASGSAKREVHATDTATRRYSVSARAARKDTDQLGKTTKKTFSLMGSLGKVMKMLKPAAIAVAVTLAAGAVSSLGAAAFAAVAGLAPLVGVLGAVPALILAVGAAAVATKVGFKGIGEALKVVTDNTKGTAEQAAALAKLGPAGQEFVLVLKAMKAETNSWSRAIQSTMLPGFTTALRQLSPLMKTVKEGLRDTGTEMGALATSVSAVIGGRKGDIRTIFAQSNDMLRTGLTPALTAFTGIFLDFAVAGGPLAQQFSTWLGLASEHLAAMVSRGRQSGELTSFLQRAGDLAAATGAVIGDVSVALFNIGRNATPLTTMFGSGLTDLTQKWRAWTESAEGQDSIKQWFADTAPLMQALGETVKILATQFMNLASNGSLTALVQQINTDLLPAIASFTEGAAMNLGPALIGLATAFIKFQSALSWSPLATMLGGIAVAANAALDVFTALPGPIKTLIASLVLLRTATKLGSGAMTMFGGGPGGGSLGQLKTALGQGAAGFKLFASEASGLRKPLAGAQGAITGMSGALGGAGKGLLGALGGPWGLALAGATAAIGLWANKQADAKAYVDELTASLDQQTGALTEQSNIAIATKLDSSGWLEYADDIGISLDVVTAAAAGSVEDMEAVKAAIEAADVDSGKFGWKLWKKDAYTDDVDQFLGAIESSAAAVDKAKAANDRHARATKLAAGTQMSATETLRAKVEADRAAAASGDRLAGGYRRQGGALQYVITKTKELRTMQLEAMRGQIGFEATLDATNEELRNGKRTLDINTEAGRANKTAILDLLESAASLKNDAKRTDAIKTASKALRNWAGDADGARGRINELINRVIKTRDVATDLDGTQIDVTVNAFTDTAMANLRAFADLAATTRSAGQALFDPRFSGANKRDGGLVVPGQSYIYGEVGPELLVQASGVSVIGEFGRTQGKFSEPGVVLPTEAYRAATAPPSAPPEAHPQVVAVPGRDGRDAPQNAPSSHDAPPLPPIHNHFHGETGMTPAEVEAATLRALRKIERERRERK